MRSADGGPAPELAPHQPRIGILVVAYNAEGTLAATLDRIPLGFRHKIDEILICDDASADRTSDVALRWQSGNSVRTTVVRHVKNLGYGGNQKAGYQIAIEHGLDIIVLLHGDGQYAPECLPDLVAPLERGECDAVFGSRMMTPGGAREGGMPLYKWLGNRVLTRMENKLLGSNLTEFHSGYRAYNVHALAEIPFQHNTDDFDFDTQIIFQLVDRGRKIIELPIPTYYGDEICYVNGMKYARDVASDALQYRFSKMGFGVHDWVPQDPEYALKAGDGSSHRVIIDMLRDLPPGRVLDVGCSGGRLGQEVRALGHHVTGIDVAEIDGVRDRLDAFMCADLEHGVPADLGGGFDVILAADVIEHVARPTELLAQLRERLAPEGRLLISTPNFAHWYPRIKVTTGRFDYDRRGILDETHLRFFTRRSLRRTIEAAGFAAHDLRYTGLPFDAVSGDEAKRREVVRRLDASLVRMWPTMFGYQFVMDLRPRSAGFDYHESTTGQ
jgi:2-polyprenyl-3-methyl-5-hydroxy-6-metoxy-1,4-benzoquinol methylase